MTSGLATVAYLVAGVLFIASLGGLSGPTTARRGNLFGIAGMLLAIAVTAATQSANRLLVTGVLVVGGALGALLAARVEMTAMPQLVAILHSFVGAAAVLVGIGSYLAGGAGIVRGPEATFHEIELFVGVFAGAVTCTGSVVAFAKLQGLVSGRPLLVPGRHAVNLALVAGSIAIGWRFLGAGVEAGLVPLLVMTALAGTLGAHLVAAIGGADMPVVVSMLNSYSGWTAAAAGFVLDYDLLVVTGALVGASGAILSYVMCRAMNRSFASVVLGGFGADEGARPQATGGPQREARSITAAEVAELLRRARSVIIVPGYGLAVSRAQGAVRDLVELVARRGRSVRFAIHPVAGRLPGHMNVLLAEARIPYDIVDEMEEINDDFPETDVVLVVGANDIVNPGAQTDPSSPIYGMPVLEVWKAKSVVVLKRSLASGYAGVENALFFEESTSLLFGDAKESLEAIVAALRSDAANPAAA